jgi:hypothetical protein
LSAEDCLQRGVLTEVIDFNGAAHIERWNAAVDFGKRLAKNSFNGPRSLSAEILGCCKRQHNTTRRFNGPRSIERGALATKWTHPRGKQASTGPRHLSRDKRCAESCCRLSGFNGAALN